MNAHDFNALYAQRDQVARRLFASLPGIPAEVIEDGLASAYEIAWRRLDRLDALGNSGGYLVVVARNAILLELRRHGREVLVDEIFDGVTTASKEGNPSSRAETFEVLAALASLKPQQRQCVGLRAAGLSRLEIQTYLGRTATWVNRHVYEGRRALRQAVAV